MLQTAIVVSPLSCDEARACITRIRDHYQSFWFELRDFHAGRGWVSLGYSSFKGCIEHELGMSERRAYQLLAAAEVYETLSTEDVFSTESFKAGHAEVLAPLPAPEQRSTWAEAVRTDEAGRPSMSDLRRIVKERAEEIKAERSPRVIPTHVPEAGSLPCLIERASARDLPLLDNSVHLQVTSPPYGLDIPYIDSPDAPDAWIPFMQGWLAEAYRVAVDGGRLALNVPLDTTLGGHRPTYAQAVACAEMVGWTYRFSIVWAEDNINKSVARGSIDSPSSPHVIAPVEMISVLHKGEWRRTSESQPSIEHDEWLEWTNGLWRFAGESRAWEGHPAPFPEQLPARLIQLLSFPGDTVLDQFLGSGTSAVAAWKAGRHFVGFDISEEYVASSRRRLQAAIEAQQ